MELQGVVHRVGEVQTVGTSNFKKREVVIKTSGEYPQHIPLEIVQDKADKFNGKVGQSITAKIELRGREWTNPQGEIKCFVSVNCWSWDLEGSTQEVPTAKAPQAPVMVAQEEDDSDLPF